MILKNFYKSKINLIIASAADLILFFFIFSFKESIKQIPISIFLSYLLVLFIWLPISYFLGRYQPFCDKKFRKMRLRYLKKLFLSSIITYFILISLSDLYNDELKLTLSENNFYFFYILFCFLSFSLQELLVEVKVMLNNEYKNVLVYLGQKNIQNKNIPKELLFFNNNVKFTKFKNINQLSLDIDEIILIENKDLDHISAHFKSLVKKGVSIYTQIEWYEKYLKKIPSRLYDLETIFTGKWRSQSKSIEMRIKRFGDLFMGLFLLIIFSPVLLICGLAIKIQDGGPILYKQTRTGLWGNKFTIVKLRTMIINSEQNGPRWSSASDSRVTKIGRILRKYRLDELPQLLQVIKGEMSLIGPRPERPEINKILTKEIPYFDLRSFIRPGLSGWAQINYPYGASIEDAREKLSYDIFYLKNFSFWLDLLIFVRTILMLIKAKGSNPKQ